MKRILLWIFSIQFLIPLIAPNPAQITPHVSGGYIHKFSEGNYPIKKLSNHL